MTRAPAAVRFEAKYANACWQFDMSPSDLKHIEQSEWIESGRGKPALMLFSAVDDRSGLAYQEYRCVYGEDAETALRFLFIDEAHDLHGNTLNGLKRLMEIVDAGGGVLSIVLVGHPRLQNDLRRATMEEIGHRSTTIEIAGLGKDARPFID